MDYQYYTEDDFFLDEKFQDWVFRPNPTLNNFWETFLQQYPEKQKEVYESRKRLYAIQFYHHLSDGGMHQRIRTRLQLRIGTTEDSYVIEKKSKFRQFYPYWVAASIALVILFGVGLWQIGYNTTPKYQTAYGATQNVWLPDSTLVVLNANSSITFPDYNNNPLREVWLEGEAFFEVTENKERPFIVHVDEMDIRVTGTSFNVAFREGRTQVVLASGQVILESEAFAKPFQMKPGDLVAFDNTSRQVEHKEVTPYEYTAWRDRIYFFKEAALEDVAKVIETYYGKNVQLDPAVSGLKFTAKVTMQKEADELLTLLSETFDLEIITKQNQIMIKKEK
ncbi:MAG: hypothetical protein HC819_21080 [Cyclobacteriaceae bacterium]|nr:hypothetical protein [Cyclobacteriaceae bacterium]